MSKDQAGISRRRFLCAGGGVVATAALLPSIAKAQTAPDPSGECPAPPDKQLPHNRIGIQLYTVRDKISSLGFATVLETLAGIGYNEVEFAGYTQGNVGPITPQEIRQLLDDNHLRGVGAHAGVTTANVQQALDTAEILGLPYVGNASASSTNSTVAGWQQTAQNYNVIGQAAADRGLKFYLHNHSTEFGFCYDSPTTRIYDVLLAETDPNLVFFEMDIFWAYVGQFQYSREPFGTFEPIDYVTSNIDRFPLFHVKDGKTNQLSQNGYDMVDVGQGNIDFETFFHNLPDKQKHSFLNENDEAPSQPRGSFGSALTSYYYMRYGFAEPSD